MSNEQEPEIPYTVPGTSLWVRRSRKPDFWAWWPALEPVAITPARLAELEAEGWVTVNEQTPDPLLLLSGQLARLMLVSVAGESTIGLLTQAADLQHIQDYPVYLAFWLAAGMEKEIAPDARYINIAEAAPSSHMGVYGVAHIEGKPYYLAVNALDEGGIALFHRLSEILMELVQPPEWMPFEPKYWQIISDGQATYEAARKAALQGATRPGDVQIMPDKLEATRAQYERFQRSRANRSNNPATSILEKEARETAQQLAEAYWRLCRTRGSNERPQPIDVFGNGYAFAPLTMVQDGAQAAIHRKHAWEKEHLDHQHGGALLPRYIHRYRSGENEYWLQHPEQTEAPIDPDLVSQEVLKQLASLDDWEADLTMLAPVYPLAKGQEEVAIAPEQLLRDMGIHPKHNQAGYGNGYRPEELQRVTDAFERLAWLQIKIRQTIYQSRGRKPVPLTVEAPFLVITERIWYDPPLLDESGPRRLLGWKYQIPWLKKFTGDTDAGKQLGVLLKKSLAYSHNQRWEKRLACYLTIHLCVAAHKGQTSINCIIRHVLEQYGLAPTERDKHRPDEYARQFERAMDHLKADGIIGDWIPKIDRKAPGFPTRAWLDLWLDSSFRVTQAPTALEAGYRKMIEAAIARAEKGDQSDSLRRRKRGRKSSEAR